jgi:hypothetical protein
MARKEEKDMRELFEQDFYKIRNDVSKSDMGINFPEIEQAKLVKVENGKQERREDIFPMRQVDSRGIKFEYSEGRYKRFLESFDGWLGDALDEKTEDTSRYLFIGAGVVRPIVEFDQVDSIRSRGPRHQQVLRTFYSKRQEIDTTFEEIFGKNAQGDRVLSNEIRDIDLPVINGLRVVLSYLRKAYDLDPDKERLFYLITEVSRNAIKEVVSLQRPDFRGIGRAAYGFSEGGEVGDRLTMSVVPPWVLALASPISQDRYEHLGLDLWEDKLHIDSSDIG